MCIFILKIWRHSGYSCKLVFKLVRTSFFVPCLNTMMVHFHQRCIFRVQMWAADTRDVIRWDCPRSLLPLFIKRLKQEKKNVGSRTTNARLKWGWHCEKGSGRIRVIRYQTICRHSGMLRALWLLIGPRLLSHDPLTPSSCLRKSRHLCQADKRRSGW